MLKFFVNMGEWDFLSRKIINKFIYSNYKKMFQIIRLNLFRDFKSKSSELIHNLAKDFSRTRSNIAFDWFLLHRMMGSSGCNDDEPDILNFRFFLFFLIKICCMHFYFFIFFLLSNIKIIKIVWKLQKLLI